MHEMVWGAYLEVLAQDGKRLDREERRMLAKHRQWLLDACEQIAESDEATDVWWSQLELFGDEL